MSEAADDVPNVLMLIAMVLLICTTTFNSDNGVSSVIFMVLFNYLKFNFSATKMNFEKQPAGGGARG